MPKLFKVIGGEGILANLRKKTDDMAAGAERGIKKSALLLQATSQQRVPVNFGVLKASASTRATGKGFDTRATVAYTAPYAVYVHEAVEMKLKGKPRPKNRGRYWDPQGQATAKFLENPAKELRPTFFAICKEEMVIK